MSVPMSEDDTLEFIGWLLEVRKVKGKTINSYLAGLRQMHVMKGATPPVIRTELINLIIKGIENRDNIVDRRTAGRLPITITVMKLLKNALREWEVPKERKKLVWAVATLAFHGGFRIHEILAKQESSFDPDFTLLTGEVTVVVEEKGNKRLSVKLKSPKEDRTGKVVIVDIHETRGSLCPIRAFENWHRVAKTTAGLPLFRDETGVPLTGAKLNKILKDRIGNSIPGGGKFTSHSFRSGLA